jgi:glycosyltransferase involved in cell wall biosynthesis
MENKLTIIVPTKNEEKYIGRLLQELHDQGVGETSIIIADNNSQDRTLEVVQFYSTLLKLNVKVIEGGLPAKARNNGAQIADTMYLLFLDADVTFTRKDAIQLALKKVVRKKIVSSTPKYSGQADLRATFMFFINNIITKIISTEKPFAIGAFTMVRKTQFDELGGYDETVIQSEDFILSKQFSPKDFALIPGLITQDNRRFKRFGYFNMVKMMYTNWVNRNNLDHFKKDNGYWK